MNSIKQREMAASSSWLSNQWKEIKAINKRQVLTQILSLALVICSALAIWKSLILATNSESPIVVVLSGSMEPGMQRGDLLFLSNASTRPPQVGDIVVFKIAEREIPIVHRILRAHDRLGDGALMDMLTKGDNNAVDDRGLYRPGQRWLNREHILGRARAYLPYVGMVTILMNDYPWAKFLLIGVLALLVLTSKDQQQ